MCLFYETVLSCSTCLRVEFLLKTDSGYLKDMGATLFTLATPGNPLRYNTHRSAPPVSALAHSRGRSPNHQFHIVQHRDTYGQAQVCSKGHRGSSVTVDHPCQPSFHWIKFWHGRNPLPQSIWSRLSVLVHYWAGQGDWSLSWTASVCQWMGLKKKRTYHSYMTTAWRLSTLRCLVRRGGDRSARTHSP